MSELDTARMSSDFGLAEQQGREAKLLQVYQRENPAVALVNMQPFYATPIFPLVECMADFTKMEAQARRMMAQMASSHSDTPVNVATFITIGMVAEAFGASVEFLPTGEVAVLPAFDDISAVRHLKPTPVRQLEYYSKMRAWVDYSQSHIGTDYPFWGLDIQGPFSVADTIMGTTNLMLAMYDDPELVHKLLQMITDVSIELHSDHLAQAEHPGFPGRNFPSISENVGLVVSEDTPMIMLSPDMYREFSLPYVNQLSQHFGGLSVHCCGDWRLKADCLLEIDQIRAVQLHGGPGEFPLPSETEEDSVFAQVGQQICTLVDSNVISRSDEWAKRPLDFHEEYLLPRLTLNPPNWLIVDIPEADPATNDSELVAATKAGLAARL
ncbi:MAG: hypothetical protein LBU38_07265 [Propionibacteriaceae bacterium]|jgi:hypothetical protein|nr:hypothetical protein [Propionibacteriaceae bacterium]